MSRHTPSHSNHPAVPGGVEISDEDLAITQAGAAPFTFSGSIVPERRLEQLSATLNRIHAPGRPPVYLGDDDDPPPMYPPIDNCPRGYQQSVAPRGVGEPEAQRSSAAREKFSRLRGTPIALPGK